MIPARPGDLSPPQPLRPITEQPGRSAASRDVSEKVSRLAGAGAPNSESGPTGAATTVKEPR